jgi:hypothetical protein
LLCSRFDSGEQYSNIIVDDVGHEAEAVQELEQQVEPLLREAVGIESQHVGDALHDGVAVTDVADALCCSSTVRASAL